MCWIQGEPVLVFRADDGRLSNTVTMADYRPDRG
jgi:hypothetical protein